LFAQTRGDEERWRLNHLDQTSGDILDLSIRLHREIGQGLLESVNETVLAGKLIEKGYSVDRQKPIDIEFEGRRFESAVPNRSARRSTRASGNQIR
jgi:hypothetical protein